MTRCFPGSPLADALLFTRRQSFVNCAHTQPRTIPRYNSAAVHRHPQSTIYGWRLLCLLRLSAVATSFNIHVNVYPKLRPIIMCVCVALPACYACERSRAESFTIIPGPGAVLLRHTPYPIVAGFVAATLAAAAPLVDPLPADWPSPAFDPLLLSAATPPAWLLEAACCTLLALPSAAAPPAEGLVATSPEPPCGDVPAALASLPAAAACGFC